MTKLNKRILSALLAAILFLTNFPMVSSASNDFAITYEGKTVSQVEFFEHEKITVSAQGNPGSDYQWQIQIPGTEQWVNIQGQTGQTIKLSKAVVGSLLVNGSAYVRCAAINDGEEIDHTAALRTTVKKEEPAPVAPVVNAPVVTPVEPVPEATEAPTEAPAEPIPETTEPPVEVTEAPIEPIPEATEGTIEETAAPTEPAVENEPVPEVVEPSEVLVETTEIPEEIVEIPAETAAPSEPEAEVVATAPAEEPATAPVEEEPAETFVDKVVKFFAPRAAADESSDIEIVTVTVHYRAVDRENKFETTHMDAGLKENAAAAEPVTDPYVAHIVSGSDLEVTVPCHVMPGYTLTVPAFHKDDPISVISNNLVLNLSGVTEDQTFYIYYVESEVSYTARYFMQNVYNDLYTERTDILTTEIQNKMKGYPNAEPDPEIIYPDIYGFTALFFQPDTIAADGSTVFEVYYDRNYYLMNFNMAGGFGTAPVYARYETAFTVAQPTKSGHTFNGWKEDESKRAVNADGSTETDSAFVAALETHINGIPTQNGRVTKIPFSNLTYEAKWIQNGTTYKVAYWILDKDGNKTYLCSDVRNATSGTKIDGEDDLDDAATCGYGEHAHTLTPCFAGYQKAGDGYSGNGGTDRLFNELGKVLNRSEPQSGYAYKIEKANDASYLKYLVSYRETTDSTPAYYIVDRSDIGKEIASTTSGGYTITKYQSKLACGVECHTHTGDCKYDAAYLNYVEEETFTDDDGRTFTIKTDKQKVVEGDGSTVVNVYYKYKEYTLKFYYAYSKQTATSDPTYYVIGGSSYHYGNTDTEDPLEALQNYSHGASSGQCGQVDELPKLNETGIARYGQNIPQNATYTDVSYTENDITYSYKAPYVSYTKNGTTYKWYYVAFTARYNDNITALWPAGVFKSVTRTSANNHGKWDSTEAFVSAWNGEHHVLYTREHPSAQTIKGNYQTLDKNLLWKDADWYGDGTSVTSDKNGEVDYVCFWDNGASVDWSVPSLFRYYTYIEALQGETNTVEYGGKYYKQLGTYLDTIDNFENNEAYSIEKQTPTDLIGYTYLTRTYDTNITLPDDQDELYKYKYNVYFYYTRNQNTLNFWNVNDYMVDGNGEQFYYGASLSKFKVSDNNTFMTEGYTWNGTTYGPYYPDSLEPKAYTFVGWYTSAECYDETKVNWQTMTMPDADLTVYAKWVPVEYTTYFYMDYERYMDGTPFHTATNTPHGESILSEKLNALQNLAFKDKTDKVNPKYRFVNWFYIDTDGTKKAFNPSEMAVRKELHLFAEWTSSEVKEYTVSYHQGKWNETTKEYESLGTLAEDSRGYALEATTKTFTALPKDKLTQLPAGTESQLWLPHTNSHSIVMREDNEDNVFTFYYITKEEAPYVVRYLDATTHEPIWKDADGKERKGGDEHNKDAIVTIPFKYFSGYIPDAFHKRLVLSANDEENVVIFYYTKDENASGGDTGGGVSSQRYLVMHHYPAIEGDPNSEDVVQEYDYIDQVGKLVTATQESQKGFVFDETKTKEKFNEQFGTTNANQYVKQVDGKWTVSGVVTSGKDNDANKPLVLNLYYSREKFSYKVQYIDWETKDPIRDGKTVGGIPFGKTVSENSIEITGYDLYGADESGKKTLDLTISWDKDKNVITFEYIKKKVTIKYVPICTEPGLTGGFGGVSNPIDYDKTTPSGSGAFAASGFYFKGWYSDEEGNTRVEEDVYFRPQVDLSTGIYDYTYYALFEPITLTISQQNIAENDSAVYEVLQGTTVVARVMLTGTDSVTLMAIPAGNYTVKEVSGNWTWTYNDPAPFSGTVEVVAGQENAVTFNYADCHVGSCWLHNETRR